MNKNKYFIIFSVFLLNTSIQATETDIPEFNGRRFCKKINQSVNTITNITNTTTINNTESDDIIAEHKQKKYQKYEKARKIRKFQKLLKIFLKLQLKTFMKLKKELKEIQEKLDYSRYVNIKEVFYNHDDITKKNMLIKNIESINRHREKKYFNMLANYLKNKLSTKTKLPLMISFSHMFSFKDNRSLFELTNRLRDIAKDKTIKDKLSVINNLFKNKSDVFFNYAKYYYKIISEHIDYEKIQYIDDEKLEICLYPTAFSNNMALEYQYCNRNKMIKRVLIPGYNN